jgi:hypothetical protein
MNVNVGIELGYAIRAHGEEQVLLVLNEHYGGREFLPFHLQDLGGPITYRLSPDATKEEIVAEMASLRGKFVAAIREFLKKSGPAKPTESSFRRVPSTTSVAAWYSPGEAIAEFDSQSQYGLSDDKGVYLRVSPRTPAQRPFTSGELLAMARRHQIGLLWRNQAGFARVNAKGAVVIEPVSGNGGRVRAASQVFHSGEIWGVGRDLLVLLHRGFDWLPKMAILLRKPNAGGFGSVWDGWLCVEARRRRPRVSVAGIRKPSPSRSSKSCSRQPRERTLLPCPSASGGTRSHFIEAFTQRLAQNGDGAIDLVM